jgi:hypothetical protein
MNRCGVVTVLRQAGVIAEFRSSGRAIERMLFWPASLTKLCGILGNRFSSGLETVKDQPG